MWMQPFQSFIQEILKRLLLKLVFCLKIPFFIPTSEADIFFVCQNNLDTRKLSYFYERIKNLFLKSLQPVI